MPVIVTLHVFSGRPDPTWLLPDDQAAAIEERVAALQRHTLAKPPGALGRLGYRGFSLTRLRADAGRVPLDVYVHEGVVDRGSRLDVNAIDENREIEKLLLQSAGKSVAPELHAEIEAEIRRAPQVVPPQPEPTAPPHPSSPAAALATPQGTAIERRAVPTDIEKRLWPWPWPWPVFVCPPCDAVDAPPYQPGNWNIPAVQPHNNCYNYANNRITNTFAQPGHAHGHQYTQLMTCTGNGAVEPAAVADGLKAVPNFTAALAHGKGYYVALVLWPGPFGASDFHWYRQDNGGCWSHKPGSWTVRNVDNNGNTITDPHTAARGPYTIFCSYMVTGGGVVIN